MKKIIVCLVAMFCFTSGFAQLPSTPDTLYPKRSADTVKTEPKLQGGALIDTINTKRERNKFRPGEVPDTIPKSAKPDKSGHHINK